MSRAALAAAGFVFSTLRLRINGRWQDHVLYGLLDSDPILPPQGRIG